MQYMTQRVRHHWLLWIRDYQLLRKKCDVSLVAGVNELFDSRLFGSFARAGMLSPTGRCHTFDASADG